MIYRMKQNAAGLASICILSTAALVILSTTVALYIGIDDQLRARFPRDTSLTAQNVSDDISKKVDGMIVEEAENHHIKKHHIIHYRYAAFPAMQDGNTFSKNSPNTVSNDHIPYEMSSH